MKNGEFETKIKYMDNNFKTEIDKIVDNSNVDIQPSFDYLKNAGYDLEELKKPDGFLKEFKRLNKSDWSDEELNHLNAFSKYYEGKEKKSFTTEPIDYEKIFDTTGDRGLYARRLKEEWSKRPNLKEFSHNGNRFVRTTNKDAWGEDIWDIYSAGSPNKTSGSYKDVARTISENIHNNRYSKLNTDDLINKAKQEFGTTNNFNGAMYMLPNGEMLDGSWGTGHRGEDHRSISTIYPALNYEYQGDYMRDFMKRGSIRLMPENNSAEILSMPTENQMNQLKRLYAYGKIQGVEVNGKYLDEINSERDLERFIRQNIQER